MPEIIPAITTTYKIDTENISYYVILQLKINIFMIVAISASTAVFCLIYFFFFFFFIYPFYVCIEEGTDMMLKCYCSEIWITNPFVPSFL
jgi:hypothetical protein